MMRAGGTMKVSLTPDRLKSMEVCNAICSMMAGAEFIVRSTIKRKVNVEFGNKFKNQTREVRSNPAMLFRPHQNFLATLGSSQA
jgi:hypothetical protein